MKSFRFILYFIVVSTIITSCFLPENNFDGNVKLSFSTDTVHFDTVFVGIGSATQHFKVYNHNEKPLIINKIYLAENSNNYRLNIDGKATNAVSDIALAAGDSIYIFVEVTINTDLDQLVESDSIVFELDAGKQDVKLYAFGQNVHLINGNDSSGYINTQTWTNQRPYLIYNSMLVLPDQLLTIEEGTEIYVHTKSRLYVQGSLIVNGTAENPVIFTGDRLEEWYENAPGQWTGIWLMAGSKDNLINWAIIKNGIEGLIVDTVASEKPTLTLLNSKIENMNSFGLLGRGAHIFAANTLIANCGQICVGLIWGGEYEFYHCTLANYWSYFPRQAPALFINNYYVDNNNYLQIRSLSKVIFENSIIYGGLPGELALDSAPVSQQFNYQFNHCLIKYDNESILFLKQTNSLLNPVFHFKDQRNYDYQLDTLSLAKDKGNPKLLGVYPNILLNDLNNNWRNKDIAPDIGAYERDESLQN